MEPIKAVIIEDEELARELIKNYLKGNDTVEIIGECENGFDGVKAIAELKPDLIFLDIQMPKLNGFEMLELVDDPPEIIFITAHNEFAIKAFERNAVDYLLKPYSKDRLLQALEKAVERIRNQAPDAGKMKTSHPGSDYRKTRKGGREIRYKDQSHSRGKNHLPRSTG